MNTDPQSWRELLGRLTERPSERQHVAELLGVNAFTVTRWVNGESDPRASSLKKLPAVFPRYRDQLTALIQAEFFPHLAPGFTSLPEEQPEIQVPAEYLARALSAYATTSGPFRAWTIRTQALQKAIEQLDPDRSGMEMTIVSCVPPQPGKSVSSLCERMGVGTPPWETGVGWRLLFLGSDSLAGWTVGRGEPGVVQEMEKQGLLPVRQGRYEQSAVAWPFQREGKIAGCLLVSSAQKEYFTTARLSCIEIYANLLALSFHDGEFFPLNQIALRELPDLSTQDAPRSLADFRDRKARLRREQAYALSEAEAEVFALQQMEAELLQDHVHEP